jgi:hypothetical protein
VQETAEDALAYFVFLCFFSSRLGENLKCCLPNWPDDDVNWMTIHADPRFSTAMCPDILVAAVAWYVDTCMGYVKDDVNSYVLNDIFNLNYPHGAEHVPAYYILEYTNPDRHPNLISQLDSRDPKWAEEYNDGKLYHGDCEDFAILRHALLAALGFDRDFVWNVGAPGHEFNIVLYKGAYRVMDYGYIYEYLCQSSGITVAAGRAWNFAHGPTDSPDSRQWFNDWVLRRVWPDRCGQAGVGWSFTRYHRSDFYRKTKCPCR